MVTPKRPQKKKKRKVARKRGSKKERLKRQDLLDALRIIEKYCSVLKGALGHMKSKSGYSIDTSRLITIIPIIGKRCYKPPEKPKKKPLKKKPAKRRPVKKKTAKRKSPRKTK